MTAPFRTGYVAIVGRPNVGKSTLLNRLVGQKISITSNKAQTTRSRVLGMLTTDDAQYVFIDTPGFQTRHAGTLNRSMNRRVRETLADADAVLMLVEAGRFGADDKQVLRLLPENRPVLLIVSKIDYISDRAELWVHRNRTTVGRETSTAAASTTDSCAPPYVLCMPDSVVMIGRMSSDWLSVSPSSRSFHTKVACRMKIATSALDAIGRYRRVKIRQVVAPSSTAASNTLCATPVKKLRITNAENGTEMTV